MFHQVRIRVCDEGKLLQCEVKIEETYMPRTLIKALCQKPLRPDCIRFGRARRKRESETNPYVDEWTFRYSQLNDFRPMF